MGLGGGVGLWGWRHDVAEALEAADRLTLDPPCVGALEVVHAQFLMDVAGGQDVPDDHEDAVADGDRGTLHALRAGKPTELRPEVGVFGVGRCAGACTMDVLSDWPGRIRPLGRLPALDLLPELSPAHDENCSGVANACASGPTSARMTSATRRPMLGSVIRRSITTS